MRSAPELIRACYGAYESGDRKALEKVLSDDFTFSSPLDDNISREQYFERCWPNSEHLHSFHIDKLFADGDEAFVRYECEREGGGTFSNTEFFKLRDGKISHVDVYFGSETGNAAAEEEIRAVIHEWAAALGRKDIDAVVGCFTDAPDIYGLAPPLRMDVPLRQMLEDWLPTWNDGPGGEIGELRIKTSGVLACAWGMFRMTGTKTGGEKTDLWYRQTMTLVKEGIRWKIQHMHESVPFLMDGSVKAAVDLQP